MKIRRVEAFAVSLPMIKPMKMAGVEVRTADNVLVRVTSDAGESGWGEAASAPTMTGETVGSMLAAVRYLAPFLQGMDAENFEAIDRELARRMYGNHAAKAATDIALLDLVGRAHRKPVHELLGAKRRDRIPVLWLIGTGSLESDVAEARAKKVQGVTAYKIKIGIEGPKPDAQRTIAICDALGTGMLISADANQGYSVEAAIEYVRAVEHCSLDFLEQPVAGDDLEGMARVAAASRIAIGADEGLHSLRDIERHRDARAAQGGSLKTIKLGGLRAVYRAGMRCEQLGMHVNLACKIAESSIASAAILHAAAALPQLDWGISLSSQYLARDLARTPITVTEGFAEVPRGPGLGIEVDESAVSKFSLKQPN
jgi:L-alanine-DL-glutamate epimerase-like enolase superfamily enzyme